MNMKQNASFSFGSLNSVKSANLYLQVNVTKHIPVVSFVWIGQYTARILIT